MKTTRRLIEESRGQPVRMKDIAEASGFSRQALYLHFGSRAGLMVATVQYLDGEGDEAGGLMKRTEHVRAEPDSVKAVEMFVEVWAAYVPRIYGVARQLLILRETDEAAAAAWEDRMESFHDGACTYLVEQLARDGRLADGWEREAAVDMLWTLLSIQTWESLVIAREWSAEQYTSRMKRLIRQTLISSPRGEEVAKW